MDTDIHLGKARAGWAAEEGSLGGKEEISVMLSIIKNLKIKK